MTSQKCVSHECKTNVFHNLSQYVYYSVSQSLVAPGDFPRFPETSQAIKTSWSVNSDRITLIEPLNTLIE